MRVVDIAKKGMDVDENPDGLSRSAVLMAATIAAGAVGGAPTVLAADGPSAATFGAPLVEMYFPVGVLSLDQKAALIKSVTDVVNAAMHRRPTRRGGCSWRSSRRPRAASGSTDRRSGRAPDRSPFRTARLGSRRAAAANERA